MSKYTTIEQALLVLAFKAGYDACASAVDGLGTEEETATYNEALVEFMKESNRVQN